MRVDAASLVSGAAGRRRRRPAPNARVVVDGLVRLGDVAVVASAGLVASAVRFRGEGHPDVVTAALLIGILIAANTFARLKVYDAERLTRLSHQLPRLLGGWAVAIGAVLVVLYGMKSAGDLSRLWIGYWFLAGAAGFVGWRVLVKHAVRAAQARGQLRRSLVLVGDGALIADCVDRMGAAGAGGRPVIAAALVLDGAPTPLPAACRRLRGIAELDAAIREVEAEQVVLAIPFARTDEILSLVRRLKNLPVEVTLYPDIVRAGLPLLGLTRLGDAPLVQLMRRPLDGWRYVLKSLEDRVLAALLLAALAPLLAAIAAAIRLTSPGPVLYRQLRHGFDREPILVYKFRSMHAAMCDPPGAARVVQATRDDPRVTPVGRVLRRTSLDELPQLLNVLRGDMSLVGPRPHAVAHDTHYGGLIDDYLGRHRVKPGITGWAQVNGHRGETKTLEQMRRRIELDLEYIDNWSLAFDLRIAVRTLINTSRRSDAH